MNKKEAKKIVEELMQLKSCILTDPSRYLGHIEKVSRMAGNYAFELFCLGYKIDPSEMEAVGYLHDIGKCFAASYRHGCDFHEFVGGRMLELMGHQREADIIRRHGQAYEKLRLLTDEDLEGGVVNPKDYIPNSLESMLLWLVDINSLNIEKRQIINPRRYEKWAIFLN